MREAVNEEQEAITGLVLAGGKSTRFGSDKASAPLLDRPMLQWTVAALSEVCQALVIVAAKDQLLPQVEAGPPMTMARDMYEARGPLAGIVSGLSAVETPLCFVVSCDAPLVVPRLVTFLAARAEGWDVVCPYASGFLQPLAALYRTETCLPVFRDFVGRDVLKITAAFGPLRTKIVREDELRAIDPDLESFLNANRPEALGEVERLLRARPARGHDA